MTAGPQTEFWGEQVSSLEVGRRFKQIRGLLGLSQEKLARRFPGALPGEPLTRRAVMKWEDGESRPTSENVMRYADLLKEKGFPNGQALVFSALRASESEWQRLFSQEEGWPKRKALWFKETVKSRLWRRMTRQAELRRLRRKFSRQRKRQGHRGHGLWQWFFERERERLLSTVSLPFEEPAPIPEILPKEQRKAMVAFPHRLDPFLREYGKYSVWRDLRHVIDDMATKEADRLWRNPKEWWGLVYHCSEEYKDFCHPERIVRCEPS